MPSKSAAQIEAEIDAAIDRVKSLVALGVWLRMRRWIESSSHDGHLVVDGLAGNLERTSLRFGRSPSWLSLRLQKLRGLVEINPEGLVYSPVLKRLAIARAKNAAKQTRRRRRGGYVPTRGGLHNPPKGVTQGVTVGVTPPPMVSLPTTLSSLSPPASSLGAVRTELLPVDGSDLDSRIRRFIGAHRMLTWDLKTHGLFRKLVEADGWERAVELIEEGVAAGVSFPVGWALAKAERISRTNGAKERRSEPAASSKEGSWD